LINAGIGSAIYFTKSIVALHAREDKAFFYDGVAFKAAKCVERGDFSGTYKIVKSLGKFTPRPLKAVKRKDGSFTTTVNERELRWQEHFCELFSGAIMGSMVDATSVSVRPVINTLPISAQTTYEYIQSLGETACGPDELHAKLLKVGGCALAVAVNRIETRSIMEEQVPVRWKGGRLIDLYKKKGDPALCSQSRGLLISDHLSKCFVGKLRDSASVELRASVPADQFGGCAGGGTDYATMIVRLLIAYSVKSSLSIFVLFLDLVSAYDSVIREVAIGIPHNIPDCDRLSYLIDIGLPEDIAINVLAFLDSEGEVFASAGMNEKALRMINALHTKSWAVYGSLKSIIVGYRGGRQGCKLGGVIFGAIYAVAMRQVRSKLREKNMSVIFKFPSGTPFWVFDDTVDAFELQEVLEVSFVDDSSIVVLASSPSALIDAVHVVVFSK